MRLQEAQLRERKQKVEEANDSRGSFRGGMFVKLSCRRRKERRWHARLGKSLAPSTRRPCLKEQRVQHCEKSARNVVGSLQDDHQVESVARSDGQPAFWVHTIHESTDQVKSTKKCCRTRQYCMVRKVPYVLYCTAIWAAPIAPATFVSRQADPHRHVHVHVHVRLHVDAGTSLVVSGRASTRR